MRTVRPRLDNGVEHPVVLLADYWRPGWRAGGPIVSLGLLVDRTEHRIVVLTRSHDLGQVDDYPSITPNDWTPGAHERKQVGYLRGARGLRWAMRQIRHLKPQVIHINSLHSIPFGILPLAALRLRLLPATSIVVSPHGELSRASQEHKAWKKRIGRPALRRLVPRGALWHASSEMERHDIVSWLGYEPRVYIRPDEPPQPAPESVVTSWSDGSHGVDGAEPTVLFASRIHPIKGLDTAIHVIANVRTPCRFVIAGTVEDEAHWQMCQRDMDALPDSVNSHALGAYRQEELDTMLDRARVLLLPSKGENFGQVIAEALSRGCPVALLDTTPWVQYAGSDIGIASNNTDDLIAFVDEVLTENEAAHRERRQRVLAAYQRWFDSTMKGHDFYEDVTGDLR